MTVTVVVRDSFSKEEYALLGNGLLAYNRDVGGFDNYKPLVALLKDPSESIRGGLIGSTIGTWLHIDILWIQESERGKGYGRTMLIAAEAEALKRGCTVADLTTFGFQAPGFYKKNGYCVIAQTNDVGNGHVLYHLSKRLPKNARP